MIYKDLIKDMLDEISFLELKEDSKIQISSKAFQGPMYLPIKNDKLVQMVKDNQADLKFEDLIEGIVYVISLGEYHQSFANYRDILYSYVDNVPAFLLQEALNLLDESKIKEALVYLNCILSLGYEDEKILFSLGLSLENLDISNLNSEDKTKYIRQIMNTYEKILNYDENFSLAYYKLGFIYRDFGQYKKSKIFFEKFLNLSRDDIKMQEVRSALDQMQGDIILEDAEELIKKQDIRGAKDKLDSVRKDHMTDRHYYYYSLVYLNLGYLDESLKSINLALSIREDLAYFNQKALVFQAMAKAKDAIKVLEQAIDKFGPDYYLNYNLASLYYQENDLKTAIGNYEIAYSISPSEDLKMLIDQLEEEIY